MTAEDSIAEELRGVRHHLARKLSELSALTRAALDGLPTDARIDLDRMARLMAAVTDYTEQRDALRTALGNARVARRRAGARQAGARQ